VNAQYWYGRLLSEGRGVPRDDKEAAIWFQRAAEAGMPEAQQALAQVYAAGRGVPRDQELAKKWMLRAAEKGLATSMFAADMLHESRHESEASAEEARQEDDPMAELMLARFARAGLNSASDGAAAANGTPAPNLSELLSREERSPGPEVSL
jgi:TPR repeat protein